MEYKATIVNVRHKYTLNTYNKWLLP